MAIHVTWRSTKGQLTPDNRDQCGIGHRSGAMLCVVLDGSTRGETSGALARDTARAVIDWFMGCSSPVTAEVLIDCMRQIHGDVFPGYRQASASFAIALLEKDAAPLVLHAGDCLAGLRKERSAIDWTTRPHTLANAIHGIPIAELAQMPERNPVTRSFKAREFMRPDITMMPIAGKADLVIATDGFWAELDPDAQETFLANGELSGCNDDCSVLCIKLGNGTSETVIEGEACGNLYVARAD